MLILGISLKENCPDIHNTSAINIYHELKDYGMEVDVNDPWANPQEVKHEYKVEITTPLPKEQVDGRL